MPQYDLVLSPEKLEELSVLAKGSGVSIDQLVSQIIQTHLVNSDKITRFVAKKGPKNNAMVRK